MVGPSQNGVASRANKNPKIARLKRYPKFGLNHADMPHLIFLPSNAHSFSCELLALPGQMPFSSVTVPGTVCCCSLSRKIFSHKEPTDS